MDQPTAIPQVSAAANSEAGQATHPVSTTRNAAFFGPNGLRAGWRVFLYLVLVVVGGFAIRATVRPIFHALNISRATAGDTPWFDALQRFMIFLSFLAPALVLSRLEKRPMRAYGLGIRQAFGKYFWEGALWGFAALSLLLVVMRVSNVFWFGQAHFDGRQTMYYALMWGIDFLVVGLMEEFMFRGYVQYALTSGMGFLGATVITSLLFFFAHTGNQGESAMGLLDVFLGGIVLSVMLWRTGSLWFAVGFHAAWDWAQSFFYGVPDSGLVTKGHLFEGQSHGWALLSGGSVGPEGSLYSSLIEIVLVGLVLWRFRKPLYPEAQTLPRQPGAMI
jgi:CAAX protease family protein